VNIKNSYFYIRLGWTVIAPIFGFSNFVMLIYMTLELDLPLYIFAPAVAITIAFILVLIGKTFREKQLSTDHNLQYFKATEAITTEIVFWNQLTSICKSTNTPINAEFKARLDLLKERIK